MNVEATLTDLLSQIRHLNEHWDCGVIELIDDVLEVGDDYVVSFDYNPSLLDNPAQADDLLQFINEVAVGITGHMKRNGFDLEDRCSSPFNRQLVFSRIAK